MNGCNRSFQISWQQRYPWLVYSKECDGGFCLPCVLFAIRESLGTLVTTPFNRWTKVSKVCGEHEKHRYHIDAMVAYDNFLSTSRNPQKNIQVQIESERGRTINRNREIVKSVAKCVHFCGKQCIALRGHRDDSTADQNGNRGNFLALLELRVDSGDEVLKNHLATCRANARYSSKTIQNQLIMLIGDHIRESIIQEIKEAKYFSILCDEVTDNANLEQLSLVLRFVDKECMIREEFVDFRCTDRITGQVISSLILEKLDQWGLDISNCRGQGYDGASNMSAQARGVQGLIAQKNPKALYVHCNSHVLNLVIVKACSLPSVRNMAGTITEISQFFNYSPKRQRCLEKVISADQPDSQRTKIRDLCRTRWVERHEAYETFALLLPSIVKTFEVILDEQQHKQYSTETPWNWDRETLQKANGFYHTCCSFQFLIALIVTMKTLAVIKPISIKLQKKSNDIVKAYCMISDTEKELKEKRDEAEAVFKRWYSNAVELSSDLGTEPSVPRTASRQQHRANAPHDTPEEYYRRNLFVPFLDHITQEMSSR